MPRFTYKAYDTSGVLRTGEVAANTRTGALDMLMRRSEFPIEIIDGATPDGDAWWQRDVFGARPWPARDLAAFTRELSTLIQANIALDEALRIVALQPLVQRRVREATHKILEHVNEGQSLSQALQAQSPAFPDYYCRLVEAGESGGALAEALDDLARFTERSAEVRARIGSALLYPAVLLTAALAAVGVIATVLLPAIQPIFEDAKVEPPFVIELMTSVQTFLSNNRPLVVLLFTAVCAGVFAASRSPGLRLLRDRLLLKVPLVGRVIEHSETARFSRTLSAMLRNGVPVLEAVQTSGGVLANGSFQEAVRTAGTTIKEGGSLISPLARSGVFPDLFVRLASVGEKSGQLDAMLTRVAEIYDATVQRQLDRLTSLLTPLLTLLIGAVVGTLILSVMDALVSVNELALK
jgi:general secretion pathway protein F